MRTIRFIFSLALGCLLLAACSSPKQKEQPQTATLPGAKGDYTLLPNGWKLSPAGESITTGLLPLNIVVIEKGRFAVTSNSGAGGNSLSLIDLSTQKEIQQIPIHRTFRGLAWDQNAHRLFVSGGNDNDVIWYTFKDGMLGKADSLALGAPFPQQEVSVAGVAYLSQGNQLLVATKANNMLYKCDVRSKRKLDSLALPGKGYEVRINSSQTKAYVSIWGQAKVAEVNLKTFSVARYFDTDSNPCDLRLDQEEERLYVAAANTNAVDVIDLEHGKIIEKLNTAIAPNMPYGSTPNALWLDEANERLYVANADNNYLAVFQLGEAGDSKSLGFIPTGWYPTAIAMSPQDSSLLVCSGKGLHSKANPKGPTPYTKNKGADPQYIANLLDGVLSFIPVPNADSLEVYSHRVYRNTPFPQKEIAKNGQQVIPVKHDSMGSQQIKHVFYIIKENRTYDEVYGDMTEGNGDSSLCLFGEKVTPNQHQLARDFVLFDNFYVDAEVSADGHNWSTAAYANDYVEKIWPVYYGHGGGHYDFEGGVDAAAPASGYIWNNVVNKDLSIRDYGEFAEEVKTDSGIFYQSRNEDMKAFTCPHYSGFDLHISDLDRYKVWEKEFDQYVAGDSLPNFTILRLPNDHTIGTVPGQLTPTAYVAQNDYALGKIVEKISHSPYWKSSAIFVVEDDAQNGPDHVDAHRSGILVISPFTKRHFVDHTMYSTSGMLKTMELILGLPPMTQYDLAATPFTNAFQDKGDFSPFNVIAPKVNLEEKNGKEAYGAEASQHFTLDREDAIPEMAFNQIIWKSVKGKESEMPAPRHSAFLRSPLQKIMDED